MMMRTWSTNLLKCMAGMMLAMAPLFSVYASDEKAAEVYRRKWTAEELQQTLAESEQWFGRATVAMNYAPAPWTPMAVAGQDIECWGKVYRYRDSLLPVQVLSQGKELFAGEPRVVLQSEGTVYEFSRADVSITLEHEGLVNVKAVSRSGPFVVEMNVGYEFDGMGKVHMTVSADRPREVESLHLEVPLAAERTVLFHHTGSRFGLTINGVLARGAAAPPLSDSGFLPEDGVYLDTFREIIWLGDREVGFAWFPDGMHGWPIKDEADIQVIEPERNGARTFRVKFADKQFTLNQSLELVFGIQATPMKPRSADFRSKVGWESTTRDRAFLLQWRWGDGYYYPFQDTYPEEAREDVLKERAKGREILTTSSLEYFGPHRFFKGKFGEIENPGLTHREVLLWKDLWSQQRTVEVSPQEALKQRQAAERRRREGDVGGRTIEEVLAEERHTAEGEWYGREWKPSTYPERFCYASSSSDYYIWKLQKLVAETGLGALYLDNQLYECANPAHGCGYIDHHGEWSGQGNVFAMREMAKRIYFTFIESNGTPPSIMWHSSNQMIIPALSFINIFWEGEKYTIPEAERSVLGNEFYSAFLDEGVMQVQHTGKQFGFTADFLPQLTRAQLRSMPITSPTIASARDMMGLLLIHDSHIDGYRSLTYHGELIAHILNTRSSYPLDEMKVLYYWQDKSGITVAQPRVKYIMHYDAKQALVILFNWSDEQQVAEVTLDPTALGAASGEGVVRDAFSSETIGAGPRHFEVDLLPRDFRMLEVKW